MHTTIYSISESPRDAKVLWVGTDDGNLQLSRDAGRSWTNVVGNVTGLPKAGSGGAASGAGAWVSWVEASRFDAATAYATFDRHTFGDMTPWVYRTTDYGATWTRIVSPDQGVRGYAHVIKEDVVERRLLFVGTELGLWISIDGGGKWAKLEGGDFPSVAVREVQVHPRDNDLVIATHGRGVWIVDDLSPLRVLSSETLGRSVAFLGGRTVQQRMPAHGGWSEGDASFAGQNPASGAVITYYQRARHVFGRMKIEILDEAGKIVDTIGATKRRGINRVTWSMRIAPPRVPRAAQVAYSATQGPRVVPGKYAVRLTKGGETIETKIDIGLDRRAPYNAADRKAHFDAAMRARDLFGEMSALVDRIDAARGAAEGRVKALPDGDALKDKLRAVAHKLEESKKKIVATKEGGAITGEERIREHLDILYGAFVAWEGRPTRYQLERIDVLRRELTEVSREVDATFATDVRALDADLKSRKLDPIPTTAPAAGGPQASIDAADARCVESSGAACDGVRAAATRD
jgi:hypothetical protein